MAPGGQQHWLREFFSCTLECNLHAWCQNSAAGFRHSGQNLLRACPCALQVKGNITYNGQGFDKFVAVHTAAYVDQVRASVSGNLLLPPCSQRDKQLTLPTDSVRSDAVALSDAACAPCRMTCTSLS